MVGCSYIYIYIYIYTHTGSNKTNTFKLIIVSCFHIHQAYITTLPKSTHIITTKFKLLSDLLTPMLIVLINIAVNQYDASQEEFIMMATFGNKFCTLVQKALLICPRNYVLFCYAQITTSCTTSARGGVCSYIYICNIKPTLTYVNDVKHKKSHIFSV